MKQMIVVIDLIIYDFPFCEYYYHRIWTRIIHEYSGERALPFRVLKVGFSATHHPHLRLFCHQDEVDEVTLPAGTPICGYSKGSNSINCKIWDSRTAPISSMFTIFYFPSLDMLSFYLIQVISRTKRMETNQLHISSRILIRESSSRKLWCRFLTP